MSLDKENLIYYLKFNSNNYENLEIWIIIQIEKRLMIWKMIQLVKILSKKRSLVVLEKLFCKILNCKINYNRKRLL